MLLGEEGLLKISDFGNARFSYDTCHWTINALPIRWMSPEAFSQGEFSEKSDMCVLFYAILYACASV